jgi:predicted acyl esterase
MQIDYDVPIPMDDGVVLRADIFRPPHADRSPVILSYGPYAKGLPYQLGYPDQWKALIRSFPEVAASSSCRYQNWEVVDPERWVPDGYACMRVDSRGAGRSPGVLDIFSPRETLDYSACIEWAARQPWSTGKVGLNGISYYAINQWLVAGRQPPHLAAMCSWEGAADSYRDWHRHGGILCTFTRSWFDAQVKTIQHGIGMRGAVNPNTGELVAGPETVPDYEMAQRRVDPFQRALLHELDGPWYRERSPDWSRVTVPFLSAGNWGGHGLHLRGNIEAFVRAASAQKWLEIHGLEHWTHFSTNYGLALQKQFFDHFLRRQDNGWDRTPRVRLNIRHVDGLVVRMEHEWPLARTRWMKLHLDPAQRTLSRDPLAKQTAREYRALTENVSFRTPPFAVETEITGPLAAKLFVSSTTSDANLFVVLRLLDPTGEEVTFPGAVEPHAPIAQGWLRASHRKLDLQLTTTFRPYHSHDEIQPLTPGRVYEVDVEVWPTCIVVPAGHALEFVVQGADFERDAPSGQIGPWETLRGSGPFLHNHPWDRRPEVYGGQASIYGGGASDSHLLLPVISGNLP